MYISQEADFLKHEVVPTLMKTVRRMFKYCSKETFQMDVTNYYPMKELLRDKYFDEGKFAALHLMLYMYFYVALILMQN